MAQWDAQLYQSSHSFVWEYGRDLIPLLAPKPGERILDLGCGSGQLTASIAEQGAQVLGVDRSEKMIQQARENFPGLEFQVVDATKLAFSAEFDAVFSNAVLHWVKEADRAVAGISRSLRKGGRFVCEFGGHGNIGALVKALHDVLPGAAGKNPWFYPTIGEYASILERHGLETSFAALFDRMTPLEPGEDSMRKWFRMFGSWFLDELPEAEQNHVLSALEARLRDHLLRDGVWHVDYRRIRVVAIKKEDE